MREIRTSGSMSGDGRRAGVSSANAPILDSTQTRHVGTLNHADALGLDPCAGLLRPAKARSVFFRVPMPFGDDRIPAPLIAIRAFSNGFQL